jgi:tetratricopeptide (TPR) repeat protein
VRITVQGQDAVEFCYQALTPQVAAAYRLLGLHPGPDFDLPVAAAILGTTLERAAELAGALVRAHLLKASVRGQPTRYRFCLSPEVARQAAQVYESPAARDTAVARTLDYYLVVGVAASRAAAPGHDTPSVKVEFPPAEVPSFTQDSGLEWLEVQQRNLIAAAACAYERLLWRRCLNLAQVLDPLVLDGRCPTDDWARVDELALDAGRHAGDRAAQVRARVRLAQCLTRAGRFPEARTHVVCAQETWRKLNNRRRLAKTLRNLGDLAAGRQRHLEAIVALTQAMHLYREDRDQRGTALVEIDLGQVYLRQCRCAAAIEHLSRACRRLTDDADVYDLARARLLLGQAHIHNGTTYRADRHLQEALTAMRSVGSRSGEADVLRACGDLALQTGHPEVARRHYEQALARRGRDGDTADLRTLLAELGDGPDTQTQRR